eukprot:TRINITY_DN2836_c0_g1_i2.p1 TRINITY_DN2836_c0_g1~~TRINITY_DN2836_c0_g1_i2.p1  ORF type:complete len:234 (+),score=44.87 TRINITY_DN2836_c0_g1_i2:63-764(+)
MERLRTVQTHLRPAAAAAAAQTAASLDEFRQATTTAAPGGVQLQGLSHLALVCSDMARTVRFYTEVVGLRLTKTIDIGEGGQHFFFDVGRGESLAYFWFPNQVPAAPGVASVDPEALFKGKGFTTANGSMNHVAFAVASPADVKAARRRLLSKGVRVSPVIRHCDNPEGAVEFTSCYFFGPDGEYLEFTHQHRTYQPQQDVAHLPKSAGDVRDIRAGAQPGVMPEKIRRSTGA